MPLSERKADERLAVPVMNCTIASMPVGKHQYIKHLCLKIVHRMALSVMLG